MAKHPTYKCGEPIHIGDRVWSNSNAVTGTVATLGRSSVGIHLRGGAVIHVDYDDIFIQHNHKGDEDKPTIAKQIELTEDQWTKLRKVVFDYIDDLAINAAVRANL